MIYRRSLISINKIKKYHVNSIKLIYSYIKFFKKYILGDAQIKQDFFETEKVSYDANIAPENYFVGWKEINKLLNTFGENGFTCFDL